MLPGQLGHELKYYLNKFHFLKIQDLLETFDSRKKFSSSYPKCFPLQHMEFLMALKKKKNAMGIMAE